MAAKQRCPKCNSLNAFKASQCVQCGAPLVQVCPVCGSTRPWYVARCGQCEGQDREESSFASLFHKDSLEPIRGRYIVRETLQASGLSAVYRAVDAQNPSRSLLVKEYSTVALFRAHEKREAISAFGAALKRWATLAHPALVTIVESFQFRDKCYVVVEQVDGLSMAQMIDHADMRIPAALARNWGGQICSLMTFLHSQSPTLHVPFLAPAHLMVDTDGQVRLAGLGLGRLFGSRSVGPHGSTRGYGAPELQNDAPSIGSDIFSLGRLLYALLIHRPLEKGLGQQLPLRRAVPGISNDLVKGIARAAHRVPEQRFPTAAEFGKALWNDSRGPLEPRADWLQQVTLASADTRATSARPAPDRKRKATIPGMDMEEYGFRRDSRFGPVQEETALPSQTLPGPNTAPRLSVYPHSLNIGEIDGSESKRVVLSLRNSGDASLVGRIVSHADWIKAPNRVIKLPAGKRAKVLLTILPAKLPAGDTRQARALLVDTNAGRLWVGASARVYQGAVLAIDPEILEFGQFPNHLAPVQTVTISNSGRAPLTGQIRSTVAWVQVRKPDLHSSPGESVRIPVVLDPTKMPPGPQHIAKAILVDSDGGQARLAVQAHCVAPRLDLGTKQMDFGSATPGQVPERLLYIGNTGDGRLEGTVRSAVPWLQAFPRIFECAPGEMVQITVTADCTGLAGDLIDIPQALRIQSNGGTRILSLRLKISAPKLIVAPENIDFGSVALGETATQALVLSNGGTAAAKLAIEPLVDWLSVDADSLTCGPGESLELGLVADTSFFPRGQAITSRPILRLVHDATVREITATLTVIRPALFIEPDLVDFGYLDPSQPETRVVLLANTGTGQLAWNAQSSATWLEVSPTSGTCQANQETRIQLTAYALGLEAGVSAAEASLVINSNVGRVKISLRMALAEPLLATDTLTLDVGASVNRQARHGSFRIFNHGLGMLHGQMYTDRTWLALDRTSFRCSTGHSIEVRVSTDMEEFPAEANHDEALITVESNGGQAIISAALDTVRAPIIVAPETISLSPQRGDRSIGGRLVIRNDGMAVGHVELASSTPQLRLSRNVYDIKPGKSVRISVQWDGEPSALDMPLGIDITSNGQTGSVAVLWQGNPVSPQVVP